MRQTSRVRRSGVERVSLRMIFHYEFIAAKDRGFRARRIRTIVLTGRLCVDNVPRRDRAFRLGGRRN